MRGKRDMRDVSVDFSSKVVRLCRDVQKREREYKITDQLLRSATSIAANVGESVYAASASDYINKLQIALKEAEETEQWLEIFYSLGFLSEERYKSLKNQCISLKFQMRAAVKTARSHEKV